MILVVDDDKNIRLSLKLILERNEYEVALAEGPKEAMQIVRNTPAVELFQFNGIPHYETITPDCRRVREDLSIGGYHNFEYELGRLKEKLR